MAVPTMSVSARLEGQELILTLIGDFDVHLYDEFNRAYSPYIDQVTHYKIDFASVNYIDSAAIGLLLLLRQKAQSHDAEITLVNISPNLSDVFNIKQISELFNFHYR